MTDVEHEHPARATHPEQRAKGRDRSALAATYNLQGCLSGGFVWLLTC